MQIITRTRKVGGSLMVTVPKEIVEKEGLLEDQLVTIEVKKIRQSGFGIAAGIGSFTREDKFKGQLDD